MLTNSNLLIFGFVDEMFFNANLDSKRHIFFAFDTHVKYNKNNVRCDSFSWFVRKTSSTYNANEMFANLAT